MTAAAYPFELSLAELYWLAGAFGVVRLPMPTDLDEVLSPVELEALQKAGQASLLSRGLLRSSSGFGWQVESLPAALVRWIASVPSFLRLEHLAKNGPNRRMHLFAVDEYGLSLEINNKIAHFIIFQSRRSLEDLVLHWLALPSKTAKSTLRYELPQPIVFLPVAWKNPPLAARILQEHGVNGEIVLSTLEWATSLMWVALISRIHMDGSRNTPTADLILCGDGKSLWYGEDRGQKVLFSHVSIQVICAKIGKVLSLDGEN